jgi:class 3 adenylate cyclase
VAIYWSDSEDRRLTLSQHATDMAQRIGDPLTLAFTLNGTSWALSGPDHVEERLSAANEMIRLGDEVGDKAIAQLGHAWRAGILLERGDLAAADRDIEAYRQGARELREPLLAWAAVVYGSMRALLEGRFEEAEQLNQEALTIGQRSGNQTAVQVFAAHTFVIRLEQGRLRELLTAVRDFVDQYPALPVWRAALAYAYGETGAESQARSEFELLAAREFTDVPGDTLWLTALALLTNTCASLSDVERAGSLYELLQPYADRNICLPFGIMFLGPASHYLGTLAAATASWDEAVRHFDHALETNSRMGARPWLARTQYEYAQMLLTRDEAGDRERAIGLLAQALNTAQEIGQASIVERALKLKLQAQGVDLGSTSTSIDSVTSAVYIARPDIKRHAAPNGTVTIMFSDIEGSTPINERLGDQRWLDVLRTHNAIVREQIAAHGGFEVKSEGDGFMLAFDSARRALQCAIAIQRAFAQHNDRADEPLRVRIGLHTGEVLKEAEDFYGKHVVLASRVASQARGGEILVSSLLQELIESAGEFTFGEGREVELKGLSGIQTVVPVSWQP